MTRVVCPTQLRWTIFLLHYLLVLLRLCTACPAWICFPTGHFLSLRRTTQSSDCCSSRLRMSIPKTTMWTFNTKSDSEQTNRALITNRDSRWWTGHLPLYTTRGNVTRANGTAVSNSEAHSNDTPFNIAPSDAGYYHMRMLFGRDLQKYELNVFFLYENKTRTLL